MGFIDWNMANGIDYLIGVIIVVAACWLYAERG